MDATARLPGVRARRATAFRSRTGRGLLERISTKVLPRLNSTEPAGEGRGDDETASHRAQGKSAGESRATGAKERFFEDSPARASADVISNAERFGKDGGDVWGDDARAPARGGDAQPAGDGSGGAGSV